MLWARASLRRLSLAIFVAILLFLIVSSTPYHTFSIDSYWRGPATSPPSHKPTTTVNTRTDTRTHNETTEKSLEPLPVPPRYRPTSESPSFCTERYGVTYLERLRDSRSEYCTEDSPSSLQCFHSQTKQDRVDSFCIGESPTYDSEKKKFQLDCSISQPRGGQSGDAPEFDQFPLYWYETGPRTLFQDLFELSSPSAQSHRSVADAEQVQFSVLVKREGDLNLWHCLMEIMAVTMSIDILRMAVDARTGNALFTDRDVDRTQVVVVDESGDGPYWQLWQLLARKPVLRLKELNANSTMGNIIIPLPGASNPLWEGDWDVLSCGSSPLLQTFIQRVLEFHSINTLPPSEDVVTITYIDRHEKRRLVGSDELLDVVGKQIPHIRIQKVDFATLSFKEQVDIIRQTDVLVGVHGAGLTHAMWLRKHSAVVELLPEGFNHKGFRNLAAMLGHHYFSVHTADQPEVQEQDKKSPSDQEQGGKQEVLGSNSTSATNGETPQKERRSDAWQWDDVRIEEQRFVELLRIAVGSVYNQGERNFDVL